MKHSLLIAELMTSFWAIRPESVDVMSAIVARWASGGEVDGDTLASVRADAKVRAERREAAARAGNGSIAVLPMYGIVSQRGNMMDDVSGPGTMSTQMFTQQLRAAVADDSIGGILIDVDSPGGNVYGVAELAAEIYAARGKKPVAAVANSLAASAAYWLASAADQLYVTPGGEVGSIGVFSIHQDVSQAMAASGVKTTLIKAGKNKFETNPYGPLSDEARAYQQSRIDDYYGMFTRAVAKNRGTTVEAVRNDMGQGRVLGAQDAKTANMVDGIATFDQAVRLLTQRIRNSGNTAQAEATDAVPFARESALEETPAAPATDPVATELQRPNHSRATLARRRIDLLSA